MASGARGGDRVVGVISDTHGLLRPEVILELTGSDLIIHAGDIGGPEILDRLRKIASVVAVRGNADRGPWAKALPTAESVRVAAMDLYVLHDVSDLDLDPRAAGFHAVISGHSHQSRIEHRNGVLFLNPGSAGPRRFTLPVSVARIHVRDSKLEVEIVQLNV
ncbi:MAG: metallophosphoesterase family protein [Candidatus Methylomirabilales bacterium]